MINWWNLKLNQNDENALLSSFREKNLSYGSKGRDLEASLAKILNVKHVLMCTSGSSALVIALKSVGFSAGDEAILPNRTFIATANAVKLLGGTVKLADVDPQTSLIDVNHVKNLITTKTKVVIPVHLNGRWADIESLLKLKSNFDFKILEDTAQGFYCKKNEKFFGTFGDIASYSLGVTKFLTSGQGGFIATNNSEYYKSAIRFINQAQEGNDEKTFNQEGFNFRLSDLLSSIAYSQLTTIENKRQNFLKVFNFYREKLEKFDFLKIISTKIDDGEIPIWVEVLTPHRDQLFNFLKENKIEAVKFYPSLHRSQFLKSEKNKYPNSDIFEKNGLILPCGPDLDLANAMSVIKALNNFIPLKSEVS